MMLLQILALSQTAGRSFVTSISTRGASGLHSRISSSRSFILCFLTTFRSISLASSAALPFSTNSSLLCFSPSPNRPFASPSSRSHFHTLALMGDDENSFCSGTGETSAGGVASGLIEPVEYGTVTHCSTDRTNESPAVPPDQTNGSPDDSAAPCASPEETNGSPDDSSAPSEDPSETRRREMGGVWFRLSDSCLLALHRGDITRWSVNGVTDAIVNAANEGLLGGGGVDGAIHRAAGRELLKACEQLPPLAGGIRCRTGDAVITNGFRLPVSRIVHTVGPVYEDEETSAPLLESAYKSSLAVAAQNGVKYLAFPAISCGVYGYPHDEAAETALRTVKDNAGDLREVHFVLFEKGTWVAWLSKANESFEKLSE